MLECIRKKCSRNEVRIDVTESVNLLVSSTGIVLQHDVTGRVRLTARLMGTPECTLGLNDKLVIAREEDDDTDEEDDTGGRSKSIKGVGIHDCVFHDCVDKKKFDADRTIIFSPPQQVVGEDNEFELMRYRVTDSINMPFRVIPKVVLHEENGKHTRVSIDLRAVANFTDLLLATHVVIKIPVPNTTINTKIKASFGKAKYEPEQQAIVWRIKRFPGKVVCGITAEVDLKPTTVRLKPFDRPPINVEFQLPMFSASGAHVRFLRVRDKHDKNSAEYDRTKRFLRYTTKAGEYQIHT
mmetsp:Transcript_2292/g.3589  ORF Transcript_2292/g.3589 Transcript_2292/m.3589 type:complete len:296 (-) Transcript_2292:148-1035(-)|eukprot:CAMPEP_0119015804 /NCGR_PEP_ID=MMETSP1176-20130426/11663_1 /TAXON_ID=265551 /ORGANISM="Synedropsis recta cf, Strain CCMP1620" /LENGTH=295 /DNA_ID=CAMNT_0006969125 /DNA_START=115 /DNA_END=1002 /DNA_ORIENTATION=+